MVPSHPATNGKTNLFFGLLVIIPKMKSENHKTEREPLPIGDRMRLRVSVCPNLLYEVKGKLQPLVL